MRTTLFLLCILFTTHGLRGQSPGAAAPPTLAQALTSFTWSWEHYSTGSKKLEEIRFYRNGVAQNPGFFSARWEVTGLRTVVLQNTNPKSPHSHKKAYLSFDASFSRYEGVDFNGKTKLEGVRLRPADANALSPKQPQ